MRKYHSKVIVLNRVSNFFCFQVGKCLIGNVNPVIPPLPAPYDIINTSSIDVALPISMSSPHFFRADPKLLSMFEGLSPDPAIHDVTLDLDPITGLAVSAHKRIQVTNQVPHPNSYNK